MRKHLDNIKRTKERNKVSVECHKSPVKCNSSHTNDGYTITAEYRRDESIIFRMNTTQLSFAQRVKRKLSNYCIFYIAYSNKNVLGISLLIFIGNQKPSLSLIRNKKIVSNNIRFLAEMIHRVIYSCIQKTEK